MSPSQVNAQYQMLHPDEVELIHECSLRVLEKTGVVFNFPGARQVLARHGAQVNEQSGLVKIPPALVAEALASTPRCVQLYSMNDPRKDLAFYVDGGSFTRTTTGLNWIIDYQSPHRRHINEQDVINWTRLIQASPYINIAGSLNDNDTPETSVEIRSLVRQLHYTDKPLMYSAFSGEGMRWLHRISQVAQSEDRQSRLMVLSSVNSPLIYGWGQCEAAMVSVELGLPVCINSSAVAGVTAPVTLAGAVVQINAEMLAALTLLQLHRPGAAVIYAAHPMVMDMKTAMSSISTAEVGLMSAAMIQIGRFYGLPTSSNGLCTDSCSPDAMATFEKWSNAFLPFMNGANINGGAGSLACVGTISLEQLVIDNDIYGHFFRHRQGFDVNEKTLATEVINHVGPGNSFLTNDHTLANFRDEHYISILANRLNSSSWEAKGSKDLTQRAAEMVQKLLSTPSIQFLDNSQSAEIYRLGVKAEAILASLELHI